MGFQQYRFVIEYLFESSQSQIQTLRAESHLSSLEIDLKELYGLLVDFPKASERHHPFDTRHITLVYKDRNGKLQTVTEKFPHDTDYGWRQFCFARFWVVSLARDTSKIAEAALEDTFERWSLLNE